MLASTADIIKSYPKIDLEQMWAVKLMNRVDSKYLISAAQLDELLMSVHGRYMSQVVEGTEYQKYHTVYLDDAERTMYLAHHNGRLVRQKVRVRSYVDCVGLSFFEIKLKNNHGRTRKKRIPVEGLDTLAEDGAADFLDKEGMLGIPLEQMHPVIENDFERITLVNNCKTERITIDTGLSFHNLLTDNSAEMEGMVVVEVKRDGHAESDITDALSGMRVHPTGFSKYCIGSAITDESLKRNRFIVKIRRINKLFQI